MAAWGLCRRARRGAGRASPAARLGRVPLAIACGAAGFLYGAILDFSTWVTFSGAHTLGQFVVYSGTSLPFNLAHAVGNVLFCLAFGPAFVRALLRFRERFAVRFEPVAAAKAATAAAAVVLVAAIAFAAVPAPPARAADAATRRATAYVLRAQNRDGGFGAKAGAPSAGSRPRGRRWASPPSAARPSPATGRFLAATRAARCATRATSSARSSPSSPRAARRAARAASTS